MKIKLIKPYLVGARLRPAGLVMEVARVLGKELIEDGTAIDADPEATEVKKPHKTK